MKKAAILENIIFPLGDKVIGGRFTKTLKHLRVTSLYSQEKLQTIALEKEAKLIEHALTTVPYYKTLMRDVINSGEQINLHDFPILEKEDIRQNTEKLISNSYKKTDLIKQSSSGS